MPWRHRARCRITGMSRRRMLSCSRFTECASRSLGLSDQLRLTLPAQLATQVRVDRHRVLPPQRRRPQCDCPANAVTSSMTKPVQLAAHQVWKSGCSRRALAGPAPRGGAVPLLAVLPITLSSSGTRRGCPGAPWRCSVRVVAIRCPSRAGEAGQFAGGLTRLTRSGRG
jgi:hypothetical protein